MAPAVCKPDGSEYMEILPENPSQYNGSMWYTEKGWTPAVGWDGKIEKPGYSANPYYMWGNPVSYTHLDVYKRQLSHS